MEDLFVRLAANKQKEREQLEIELKKIYSKNEVIDREETQLQRNFAQLELDIKTNFLREINDVKLRIRRKWPDLHRKSLHDLKNSEGPVATIHEQPRDELLDIFK